MGNFVRTVDYLRSLSLGVLLLAEDFRLIDLHPLRKMTSVPHPASSAKK
jgi:hypothetical protein